MKQGSRIIIFIALVVVLGSVGCFLYYTIRFNVRRTDALNQTQVMAELDISRATVFRDYAKIKKVTGAMYDKKTSTWTLD